MILFTNSHFQYLNHLDRFFHCCFYSFVLLKRLVAASESDFVDTRPPLACKRFVCTNIAVRKTKPLVHKTVNLN